MSGQPTERQGVALSAIKNYSDRWGFAPTVRDLCELLGISTNAVNDLLKALELKGCIKRHSKLARSVVITAHGMRWLNARSELGL